MVIICLHSESLCSWVRFVLFTVAGGQRSAETTELDEVKIRCSVYVSERKDQLEPNILMYLVGRGGEGCSSRVRPLDESAEIGVQYEYISLIEWIRRQPYLCALTSCPFVCVSSSSTSSSSSPLVVELCHIYKSYAPSFVYIAFLEVIDREIIRIDNLAVAMLLETSPGARWSPRLGLERVEI
ncbi:hypothetical protein RRG08_065572 [Elysia crispata]|uniref:Uncharacterized protein n=1 Tax=Elysia crispata TaxID=231223 RepID=A0AAE0YMV8_9GAST|nr:hypothetical protein RRG08_065572 [Elysia crispata]